MNEQDLTFFHSRHVPLQADVQGESDKLEGCDEDKEAVTAVASPLSPLSPESRLMTGMSAMTGALSAQDQPSGADAGGEAETIVEGEGVETIGSDSEEGVDEGKGDAGEDLQTQPKTAPRKSIFPFFPDSRLSPASREVQSITACTNWIPPSDECYATADCYVLQMVYVQL